MSAATVVRTGRSAWGLTAEPTHASWREQALCAEHVQRGDADPEWWSLLGRKLTAQNWAAVNICRQCPVRAACYTGMVQLHSSGVVAGGVPLRVGKNKETLRARERQALGMDVEGMLRMWDRLLDNLRSSNG